MPPPTTTYLFAGGGTGGHLYPGLAIAHGLRTLLESPPRVLFIPSDRPLDARILNAEGVGFHPLAAKPFGVRPKALLPFLGCWGRSVRDARAIIRDARAHGEVHVVAMGGFVAAPVVQAARAERVSITLVNLDAVPGKANRWIARHADTILTALPVNASFAASWRTIPPIVRAGALADAPIETCRARLGLDPARPTLMVTGGSQGARTINRLLIDLAREPGGGALAGWQVLHQCGGAQTEADAPSGLNELRAAYAAAGISALVEPFVSNIADWWGAADLAVSRSGAGSVGEAWANRVPALFLPYPHHRDEHQRLNAMPLVDPGCAAVATDAIDPAANLAAIGPILRGLLTDRDRRDAMRAALERLGPADGARRAAEVLSRRE